MLRAWQTHRLEFRLMSDVHRRSALATLLALAAVTLGGRPALSSNSVLEVDGRVAAPAPHRFDLEALRALGAVELVTTTPWDERRVRFEGVPVRHVLEHCGADGTVVRARALNDYWVEIPLADFDDPRIIAAWSADGRRLTVRDKGPLWIIYPWSHEAKYRTGLYDSRSIWQLKHLQIT
jgi:hypothetical protein